MNCGVFRNRPHLIHSIWHLIKFRLLEILKACKFKIKDYNISDLLQRTKMKTGIETIPGAGHSPSTFVPTAGHLTAEVLPPPGICHP